MQLIIQLKLKNFLIKKTGDYVNPLQFSDLTQYHKISDNMKGYFKYSVDAKEKHAVPIELYFNEENGSFLVCNLGKKAYCNRDELTNRYHIHGKLYVEGEDYRIKLERRDITHIDKREFRPHPDREGSLLATWTTEETKEKLDAIYDLALKRLLKG